MQWQPHITVATVIEDQGRVNLVEELAEGRAVFNQPAGHLEADESLLQAALRETLEETGWDVELTGVTGIYLYTAPANGVTYQRVCFAARPLRHHPELALDHGIIGPRWLTREEFLEDWAVAQVLPGPNVANLGVIIGDRHFGTRGALVCLLGLFLFPLIIVSLLAMAFTTLEHLPVVQGALKGMGLVVVALILTTAVKLATSLRNHVGGVLFCVVASVSTFLAIAVFRWPLVWVLLVVGGVSCAWTYHRIVRSVAEIRDCMAKGIIAGIMHMEGAEAIGEDLDALHSFHAMGLRSIGPVWSRPTIFGHGVPFAFPSSPDTGDGLTAAGKRLIKECNSLKILIDLGA